MSGSKDQLPARHLNIGEIPGQVHAAAKIRAVQCGRSLRDYIIMLVEEDVVRTNTKPAPAPAAAPAEGAEQ